MKRSIYEGEKLTKDELDHLDVHFLCPDCWGILLRGPAGGDSVNISCTSCCSRYNIVDDSPIWFGERIIDSSRIDRNEHSIFEQFAARTLLRRLMEWLKGENDARR